MTLIPTKMNKTYIYMPIDVVCKTTFKTITHYFLTNVQQTRHFITFRAHDYSEVNQVFGQSKDVYYSALNFGLIRPYDITQVAKCIDLKSSQYRLYINL